MKKIVITGGPCAGKSTALGWIKNKLSKEGYTVLVVPETATELICGGVAPWTMPSFDYQLCQIKLQLYKENIFYEAAAKMENPDKIIIMYDRGIMDNLAYMSRFDFDKALVKLNLNETELLKSYDAVFHLETSAKGEGDGYTLANNQARTETKEEAVAIDDRLIKAWERHPRFKIIKAFGNFDDKLQLLTDEIFLFLQKNI